jgi:ATP-dependent DNA helicase DinG
LPHPTTPWARPAPNGCAPWARPVQRAGGAATAIRLAQWAGRAITEEDQAHVYCYDKRLTRTSYGQRLLKGLPPFTLERRGARGQ